jgi:hypothetical protein
MKKKAADEISTVKEEESSRANGGQVMATPEDHAPSEGRPMKTRAVDEISPGKEEESSRANGGQGMATPEDQTRLLRREDSQEVAEDEDKRDITSNFENPPAPRDPAVYDDMRDELLAAFQLIRQQRLRLQKMEETITRSKATTTTEVDDEDPLQVIANLKDQISQLENEKALTEFQLRTRITKNSLTYGETIRHWKRQAHDWQTRFEAAWDDRQSQLQVLKSQAKREAAWDVRQSQLQVLNSQEKRGRGSTILPQQPSLGNQQAGLIQQAMGSTSSSRRTRFSSSPSPSSSCSSTQNKGLFRQLMRRKTAPIRPLTGWHHKP